MVYNIITRPGEVSPECKVPDYISKPHYYYEKNSPSSTEGIVEIKSADQIAMMRKSCTLAANILKKCEEIIKVRILII